ncbi:MAG: hypothetical protein ABI134_17915, partial [Byssovorax sp.]
MNGCADSGAQRGALGALVTGAADTAPEATGAAGVGSSRPTIVLQITRPQTAVAMTSGIPQ